MKSFAFLLLVLCASNVLARHGHRHKSEHSSSSSSSAASSSSSSSSDPDDDSSVATTTAPGQCLNFPPLHVVKDKHRAKCGKGKRRVVLERTCYTPMKEVCISKNVFKGKETVFCRKNIPTCNCDENQTCIRMDRTDYRCQEAVCVAKIDDHEVIHDRPLR